ncbi:hypothetical protein [Variovorax sp. tm]|uniref:hypothetical protein n=1 Tax=Variovorax atrisoli TaxID=3394203 RepID=UPI003A812215
MFDFDTAPIEDVYWAAQHWHQFLSSYPVTVVLELSREALATDAMIEQEGPNWMPPRYQPPGNSSPHYPRWIPFVEAWHKGPISLDAVCRVFSFRAYSGDKFEDVSPITTAIAAIEKLAGNWAAEDEKARSREISDAAPNVRGLRAMARGRSS